MADLKALEAELTVTINTALLRERVALLAALRAVTEGYESELQSEYETTSGRLSQPVPAAIIAARAILARLDPTPVTFRCCPPCFDGRCGQECGHAAFDGLPMTMAEGMAKLHDGCLCWLEPRI